MTANPGSPRLLVMPGEGVGEDMGLDQYIDCYQGYACPGSIAIKGRISDP